MNRFLFGALAMGAVFVLTSFAVRAAADPAAKRNGPAWRVSDYQLDRAFRFELQGSNPATFQIPPTGGVICTQIHGPPGNNFSVSISINGTTETFGISSSAILDLNPPLIARPNDVVTISSNGALVSIAGYTTLPGET